MFFRSSEEVQMKWDSQQWNELLLKIKAYLKTPPKSTKGNSAPKSAHKTSHRKPIQQETDNKQTEKKTSKLCQILWRGTFCYLVYQDYLHIYYTVQRYDYLCMSVRIYVCTTYRHTNKYICMHTRTYIRTCARACVSVHVCMRVWVPTCTCVSSVHVCTCIVSYM
jgi:hypothetical protein